MTTSNNFKTLSEIFNEALNLRGLNIERLSELTNISKRFLTALRDGDFKNLPSAPYVRGYLAKIGEILDVDANLLWQTYKKENLFKTSGSEDKLPSNRFAIRPLNKKKFIFGVVLLLVLIYFGWRINAFFGTPQLEIINPAVDNMVVGSPSIKLNGRVNQQDKLTINNEEVSTENGKFEKEFTLSPGINTVEFKSERLLGKKTKIIRQIIYQP